MCFSPRPPLAYASLQGHLLSCMRVLIRVHVLVHKVPTHLQSGPLSTSGCSSQSFAPTTHVRTAPAPPSASSSSGQCSAPSTRKRPACAGPFGAGGLQCRGRHHAAVLSPTPHHARTALALALSSGARHTRMRVPRMRLCLRRASLAQAAASDEGVMDQLAHHQEGFASLAVEAAALKMPRLQVGAGGGGHSSAAGVYVAYSCGKDVRLQGRGMEGHSFAAGYARVQERGCAQLQGWA